MRRRTRRSQDFFSTAALEQAAKSITDDIAVELASSARIRRWKALDVSYAVGFDRAGTEVVVVRASHQRDITYALTRGRLLASSLKRLDTATPA